MSNRDLLFEYWQSLYPDSGADELVKFLNGIKHPEPDPSTDSEDDWYKDAIVYSLYVDRSS